MEKDIFIILQSKTSIRRENQVLRVAKHVTKLLYEDKHCSVCISVIRTFFLAWQLVIKRNLSTSAIIRLELLVDDIVSFVFLFSIQ